MPFDAPPANWVTVSSEKRGHLFTAEEDVTLSLSAANASGYQVRNIYGQVVADGELTPDPPVPFAEGQRWLALDGGGARAHVDGISPTLFTGDIEVALKMRGFGAASEGRYLAAAYVNTGAMQWELSYQAGGLLRFEWNTGSTTKTATATAALGVTSTVDKWVRLSYDRDNGAGSSAVEFHVSDDGSTWTKVGATVTVAGTDGPAAMASGQRRVEIGGRQNGQNTFSGRAYAGWFADALGAGLAGGDIIVDFTSDGRSVEPTGEEWVVTGGSFGGTPYPTTELDLGPFDPGWYLLYLSGDDEDEVYGTALGALQFSVVPDYPNLLDNPAAGVVEGNDYNFEHWDHATRGWAVLGPHRNEIDNAATPAAEIAEVLDDLDYQDAYWSGANLDPARPRENFLLFPNGTHGTGQPAGVTAAVEALYPAITWFEGPANEPQGTAAATVAARMETFYNAVKAGHPDAKVMGPCTVAINGQTIAWWADFLEAGGGQWLDGVSFHVYNGINDDVALARRTFDTFVALLTEHGIGHLPRWSTESTAYFSETYGIMTPARQARRWFMELLIADQYGIPKERTFTFYDRSHGFWDFPSFWRTDDGQIYPAIAMMRVFSGEVFGKPYASRIVFSSPYDDWCVGNLYTGDDGSVAAFITSGARENLTFTLTGASSVEAVDCFGATSTLTATDGVLTVPVRELPSYLRLPVGATIEHADPDLGTNVIEGATVTSSATTGSGSIASVADGELENFYYLDGAPGSWRSADTPGVLPATVTLSFPQVTANTWEIICPEPWQQWGSLLDFDVQTLHDEGWVTRGTFTVEPTTVGFPLPTASGASHVQEFYDGRRVFLLRTADITTTGLRLNIRDATYGGNAATSSDDVFGQGTANKTVSVREIRAFAAPVVVTPPEESSWLFAPPATMRGMPLEVGHRGRFARRLQKVARADTVYLLADGSVTTRRPRNPAVIQRTFLGGRQPEPVSAAEREYLIAAGYEVTEI